MTTKVIDLANGETIIMVDFDKSTQHLELHHGGMHNVPMKKRKAEYHNEYASHEYTSSRGM